ELIACAPLLAEGCQARQLGIATGVRSHLRDDLSGSCQNRAKTGQRWGLKMGPKDGAQRQGQRAKAIACARPCVCGPVVTILPRVGPNGAAVIVRSSPSF